MAIRGRRGLGERLGARKWMGLGDNGAGVRGIEEEKDPLGLILLAQSVAANAQSVIKPHTYLEIAESDRRHTFLRSTG